MSWWTLKSCWAPNRQQRRSILHSKGGYLVWNLIYSEMFYMSAAFQGVLTRNPVVLQITDYSTVHLTKLYLAEKRTSLFCIAAVSKEHLSQTREEFRNLYQMSCVPWHFKWMDLHRCSECQNMPWVLDFIDVWTYRSVFLFAHHYISNVLGHLTRDQLFSHLRMTFKRQLPWKKLFIRKFFSGSWALPFFVIYWFVLY